MKITFLCTEFQCLPHSGGLLDQNQAAIDRIDAVVRARNQFTKDNAENDKAKSEAENRLKSQHGS